LNNEPNQTSPLTSPPAQVSALASVFGGFATWGKPEPARITSETGNISVWIQKVDHSNTRGIVSSLFFSRSEITAALSLHYQHLMKTKG